MNENKIDECIIEIKVLLRMIMEKLDGAVEFVEFNIE